MKSARGFRRFSRRVFPRDVVGLARLGGGVERVERDSTPRTPARSEIQGLVEPRVAFPGRNSPPSRPARRGGSSSRRFGLLLGHLFWRVLFPRGIKERWRESARRHCPGPQTRGGDGDLSRTRSRGVARAGERAGRASRRFDRSPATRPPSCRPARRIRRKKKPQQRRSPRQPRPRGRRTRRRRSRREGRAPRGVHRRGLRARAHTQDRPGRLRARALGPGRCPPPPRPPPPSCRNPYSRSLRFFIFWPTRLGFWPAAARRRGRWDARTRPERAGEDGECG